MVLVSAGMGFHFMDDDFKLSFVSIGSRVGVVFSGWPRWWSMWFFHPSLGEVNVALTDGTIPAVKELNVRLGSASHRPVTFLIAMTYDMASGTMC